MINNNIDVYIRSYLLLQQNVDDNMMLGPGGRPGSFGSWGRGSSGGGKSSSQENERPSTPGNRFSALSQSTAGSATASSDRYESSRAGGRGLTPSRDPKSRTSQLTPRGGSKNVARLSQEQDRESALSAVRLVPSLNTDWSSAVYHHFHLCMNYAGYLDRNNMNVPLRVEVYIGGR